MRLSRDDLELAKVMLGHSLEIKPKEKVLITASNSAAFPLVKAVYVETLRRGAYPMLDTELDVKVGRQSYNGLAYQFFKIANDWQLNYVPEEVIKAKIAWADAYVRIVAEDNLSELAEIEPWKMTERMKLLRPLMDPMVDSDRWILTYYPTPGMAREAGMSLDSLEEFYFDACLVDYQKMKRELLALQDVLDQGKELKIIGKQTELVLGIHGRLAQACYGERNIPDGEVFVGPVHTEVEGEIYFDLPTTALGKTVEGVRLEFREGKVVKAVARQGEEALLKMLETDEGARYLGEAAIGANYRITRPMLNTLFDEKIGGTIHLALGRSYKDKRGGGTNESAIHWDIVKDMRLPGSRVEVDGRVVLEDGKILV